MKKKFERITNIRPAWDKRDPDPKKDYGVHGVEIAMVLKGAKGAIHFVFHTGMMLPAVYDWWEVRGTNYAPTGNHLPYMGFDVGYHSPTPQFEGQELRWPTTMRKTGDKPLDIAFDKIGDQPPVCEWLGVPCYSDGSAMRADTWMGILVEKGGDEIWRMMEEEYKGLFEKHGK